jgi:hydroxypyruvate isomerase
MGYTFPGTDLAPFHEGLDTAVEHARQLGCPRVVLASGVGFPGMNRQKNLQVIIDMFGEAVERHGGSGIEFVLEPVNSRVDHPGALTDRTEDAVVVARRVGRRYSASSTTSTTRSPRGRTRRPSWRTRRAS